MLRKLHEGDSVICRVKPGSMEGTNHQQPGKLFLSLNSVHCNSCMHSVRFLTLSSHIHAQWYVLE